MSSSMKSEKGYRTVTFETTKIKLAYKKLKKAPQAPHKYQPLRGNRGRFETPGSG